jgi:hypothetical protein
MNTDKFPKFPKFPKSQLLYQMMTSFIIYTSDDLEHNKTLKNSLEFILEQYNRSIIDVSMLNKNVLALLDKIFSYSNKNFDYKKLRELLAGRFHDEKFLLDILKKYFNDLNKSPKNSTESQIPGNTNKSEIKDVNPKAELKVANADTDFKDVIAKPESKNVHTESKEVNIEAEMKEVEVHTAVKEPKADENLNPGVKNKKAVFEYLPIVINQGK